MYKKKVVVQSATNVNMILNFGRNIADRINEEGYEYHIIYSRSQPNLEVAFKELEQLNAVLHVCPMPQYLSAVTLIKLPRSLFRFYKILRRIRPDVLHTRATLVGFIGRIAGKLAGVKNIYHHQDDFLHREEKLGPIQKWLFRSIDVSLSKITTKIFFVSNTILHEAISSGIDRNKCIMVGHDLHPNFVDKANTPSKKKHPIVDRISKNHSTVVIGTLARIEDFKGIDTILNVADHFRNKSLPVKFLIRGNGSKLEKYQQKIQEMGLTKLVHLVSEYLPADEIPWLYRSLDIFFLPTRREGFGMVFAEAMSMGVPVIAPKIHPVVEVVPDGLGCLVEPEDVKSYVTRIDDLIENEEKRQELGKKCQEYALNRWGQRSSADKVVNTMLTPCFRPTTDN